MNTQTASRTINNAMDKDAFLRILVTQLKNQDPSSPMQDKDFIAQMAQFSSLEQMTNLTTSMEKFFNSQLGNSLSQHSHLIGKKVAFEGGEGMVRAVSFKEGNVMAELEDGTKVSISELNQVEQA